MEPQIISLETKKYVENSRLTQIYEALLCGVSVMKPRKPRVWISEKLRIIKTLNYDDLEWDSFIDEWMRPKHPLVIETVLYAIFRSDTDDSQPSAEMMVLAYRTYNDSIKRKCFNALVIYHVLKQKRKLEKSDSVEMADLHFNHNFVSKCFVAWREWTGYRLRRQKVAFEIIQRLKFLNTSRRIFTSWSQMTKEAQKTREYFERLEKGDLDKEDDVFNIGDGEAHDKLSSLPTSFSVKIFSHLSIVDLAKCSQVCRSWKAITQNEALWSRMSFEGLDNIVTDRVASRILQNVRVSLSHLSLRGCRQFGPETFQAVGECRNLQDLNLSECSTIGIEWDELLNGITRSCSVLTYLNISYTNISDNALRCLAGQAHYLQYLSLAHCYRISDEGFECIHKAKVITRLLHIDLSGCNQLTVQSFKLLAETCPKIKTWVLNEIPSLSDEHLGAITTFCKRIEQLEARGTNEISDLGIKLVLTKALRLLKIESSARISDQLRDIGRHCTDIQHLFISDCIKVTDQFLKYFSAIRHLRVLNLADCVKITDLGVKFLIEAPFGPGLRELNLTNALRITDSALNQIQKRCQHLTHLTVAFCTEFTEVGMEVLANLPHLEFLDAAGTKCGDSTLTALGNRNKMQYLILSRCDVITDLGLQKFAQACRDIRHLDISFCHLITDAGIKNLAFCCRFMSVLRLNGCRQLSDLSVQFLSGVCQYIRHLDVSGCIMMTNKSLVYIRRGCRRLRTLEILYCKSITRKAVMKLQMDIPDITYSCEDPPEYYGY